MTRIDYLAPELLGFDDDVAKDQRGDKPVDDNPSVHRHLRRTGYSFWEVLILSFAIMFSALALFGQTPTPGPKPQCTQPNWYQQVCDGSWNYADPSNAGHVTPSGCQAHNLLVADDTGANITIIGQCGVPCVGFQQVFKKPDHPSDALTAWQYYYTDPDAALHRHLFHYEGPGIPPPGFQVLTPYRMIGQLPEPPRTAKMNAYGCNVTPTPVPSPTRTPTPAPNPAAAQIEWAFHNGITAGCGVNIFCPTRQVTRQEMAVFMWNLYLLEHPGTVLPPCTGVFTDVPCH